VHEQRPCETRNGGAEDTGVPTLSLVQDVQAGEPSQRAAEREQLQWTSRTKQLAESAVQSIVYVLQTDVIFFLLLYYL
jgi:hypothetical protein